MSKMGASLTVLGAGAWGTALAVCFAKKGLQVNLWGHDPTHMAALAKARSNATFLPGVSFPDTLTPHANLAEALQTDTLVMVVPSHAFETVVDACVPHWTPGRLAIATKGLATDGGWLSDVVKQRWAKCPVAILSGPSFAKETAVGCPTAVTFAADDANWAKAGQQLLGGDTFRLYTTTDIIGAQLGGVAKNVLAIAVGVSDGLKLGANARAAIITRGLAELMRLGQALGADPETLMGLSGLGDLVLTATDDQSRNRRFGLLLGQGQSPEAACQTIGHVVEGMNNVTKLLALAEDKQVDAPIIKAVAALFAGKSSAEILRDLLNRPQRAE